MNYMEEQTKDLAVSDCKLQIISDNGERTNWLNVKPDTLQAIAELLIDQETKEKDGFYNDRH